MASDNYDEKIERICIREFGYSPKYAFDIADDFDRIRETVEHYIEISGSLSESCRKRISKISFKANRVNIMITRLILVTDQLAAAAKESYALKKPVKKHPVKVEDAHELIKEIEKQFESLLRDLDEYVCDVEKSY
ncbi:hypothetical protein H0N95_02325 [Candidatus Micrarchaeota archaeon]|nr:hypothetical protein [Candidatus Micrarchaeota archaeon]